MKTLKQFLTLALVITFAVGCKNNDAKPEVKTVEVETADVKKELDPNATYAKAEFTVEGMTCAIGCAKTIEKNIAKMDGVKSAKVDFDKKLAMVEYDEAQVTTNDLEATVKKTGDTYSVHDMKTVESFEAGDVNLNPAKKECGPNCTKPCCADKKADTETSSTDKKMSCKPGCKMDCKDKKADAKKEMASCKPDCKMACCSKDAKA